MANEIIFKPKVDDQGELIASEKITPIKSLEMLQRFIDSNNTTISTTNSSGVKHNVHGFYFDISDIKSMVEKLHDFKYEFYVGLAIDDDGNHTLISGAVEILFDIQMNEIGRTFVYNPNTQPIFDYSRPCPPGCPVGFKIV